MYIALLDQINLINAFMEQGGNVLWLIALLTFAMWTLIFERVWYYRGALNREVQGALDEWEARSERKSWAAHKIREKIISIVSMRINANLSLIKTMVSLCPLLGLLGTVTGMIEVFDVLAITGGSDAKLMAGGVSKATIPTMAGMVAALSGVFANTYLTRVSQREDRLLEDRLTMDH